MLNTNTTGDKRIKRTKNALTQALFALMATKAFKDITITDIVNEADYNRGTFYRHYKYKEDLLDEILGEVIADLAKSYKEPLRNNNKLDIRTLNASAVKIFDHVWEHKHVYQLVIKANALPGFQKRITDELNTLLLQNIYHAKLDDTINLNLLSSYQSYAILGLIIEWVNDDFKYSPPYMAEQLVGILKINPTLQD
ncbi:TetR/AcrR family transcriptional regulator [Paraliobacillus sediminis]|uniref:TetR/AcrR family transcriptional regulator n=1 Tax=Paraliobacillus sediminis TaxID=1885916 RepID=UPI003B83A0D2